MSPIAPIVRAPEPKYQEPAPGPDAGYYLEPTPETIGVAVYGNHLNARPAAGAFADNWLEVIDGGGAIGYITRGAVRPLPLFETSEKKYFWTKAYNPSLWLLPGAHPLADFKDGFAPLRGETLSCVGEYTSTDGVLWLLFAFSTSKSSGASGLGKRYAWGNADEYLRLETYKPDMKTALSEDMPRRIRGDMKGLLGGHSFSDNELASIMRHGFRIDDNPIRQNRLAADDMADSYTYAGEFVPHFITTDVYFHTWHLLRSRMMKKIEEHFFMGALDRFLRAAITQLDLLAIEISVSHPGAPRDPIAAARDMLGIPLALLHHSGNAPEKTLSPAAVVEYERILAAKTRAVSLVTGSMTDYTKFKPRGHYTQTPAHSRYFRAMAFLDKSALRLSGSNKQLTRRNASAIALLCLVVESPSVKPLYEQLTAPLRILTGAPDGDSVEDFSDAVHRRLALDKNSVTMADVAADLHSLLLAASSPPLVIDRAPPHSNQSELAVEAPGFRLLGRGFALDAYAFTRLTSPAVGGSGDTRNLPRTEDVMAVLGSSAAYSLTNEYAEKYERYAFNRRALIERAPIFLAMRKADTAYSAWLRVLSASFADSGCNQYFYRGKAWEWKKLLSATASWTEMKRDSTLYVKQGAADTNPESSEATPGLFEPPRPRGYVEPAPKVFARMMDATDKLREALGLIEANSKYIDLEYERKLNVFSSLCRTARDIAEKEIRGSALTEKDFADIETISRAFTSDLLLPAGLRAANDRTSQRELEMALITDVATDYFDNNVLCAATGSPRRIFVYVNDNSAGPRITVGYVYSFYEFVRPLESGEMTNNEWKNLVRDPARRDELHELRPLWYERLSF